MKVALLALALLAFGCKHRGADDASDVMSGGRKIGALKGMTQVENALNARIMSQGTQIRLQDHLDTYETEGGLPALLGAYDGRPGGSALRNAGPNAVNVMLWQIVMDGVSTEIARRICLPGNDVGRFVSYEQHFKDVVEGICKWESPSEADVSKGLRDFWLKIMRYDAPKAEMDAWIADLTAEGGAVKTQKSTELVKTLAQSILMNPYFLLEQ